MRGLIDWTCRTITEFIEAISDTIEWFLRLDWSIQLMDGSFGVMHAISDLWGWFFQLIDGTLTRPLWQTILLLPILIPYWIVSTLFAVLSHPFSLAHLDRERTRNLVYGIPSIVAIILTVTVTVHSIVSSPSIDIRYRTLLKAAFASGNYELATVLGGRLVSDRIRVDPEAIFSYAIALQKTGETQRYQAVLASLAPGDAQGYAPAHRMRAMSLADQLKNGSSESLLKQFRWHLDNSGSELSAEIEMLWTAYSVTIGQMDEAIKHMEVASRIDPRKLVVLADLYSQSKNLIGETRALRAGEAFFDRRLKSNPLSHDDRIQLAYVRVRLGKVDLAEETVLKGVLLLNDEPMRRAAANFYVMRYDMLVAAKSDDVGLQFSYLEKALQQDLNHGPIYERLVMLFEKANSIDDREVILELLKSVLASGGSSALAHFALSGVYFTLGDQSKAEFHLDQSYSLNPSFSLVTNNLAWVIANADEPDLTKASELAGKALKANPNNPRFRDTMATILMKQGKTRAAITEFEAILGVASDKRSIHQKLFELYEKLDRHDMASVHLEKANALANKLATKIN